MFAVYFAYTENRKRWEIFALHGIFFLFNIFPVRMALSEAPYAAVSVTFSDVEIFRNSLIRCSRAIGSSTCCISSFAFVDGPLFWIIQKCCLDRDLMRKTSLDPFWSKFLNIYSANCKIMLCKRCTELREDRIVATAWLAHISQICIMILVQHQSNMVMEKKLGKKSSMPVSLPIWNHHSGVLITSIFLEWVY